MEKEKLLERIHLCLESEKPLLFALEVVDSYIGLKSVRIDLEIVRSLVSVFAGNFDFQSCVISHESLVISH
ncbi:hypothetical protein NUACC21_10310 [Scytonema sp. NUACC21]